MAEVEGFHIARDKPYSRGDVARLMNAAMIELLNLLDADGIYLERVSNEQADTNFAEERAKVLARLLGWPDPSRRPPDPPELSRFASETVYGDRVEVGPEWPFDSLDRFWAWLRRRRG